MPKYLMAERQLLSFHHQFQTKLFHMNAFFIPHAASNIIANYSDISYFVQ
jgi:hypothetical protein